MLPHEELASVIVDALTAHGLGHLTVHVDAELACTMQGQIASLEDEAIAIDLAYVNGAFDVTTDFLPLDGEAWPEPEASEAPAPDGLVGTTYLVERGDSYWRIADKLWGDGRHYERIRSANPGKERLHPGMFLEIPEAPEPEAQPSGDVHVVVKGDTWWGLAKRYLGDGRRHAELKAANAHIKVIKPGDQVTIPTSLLA